MPEFVFGLFLGGILASLAICAAVAGSRSERVPLEEVEVRCKAAADEAYRQGRLMQAIAQSEKDSARAKKAASTRKAQRNPPDYRGAP